MSNKLVCDFCALLCHVMPRQSLLNKGWYAGLAAPPQQARVCMNTSATTDFCQMFADVNAYKKKRNPAAGGAVSLCTARPVGLR